MSGVAKNFCRVALGARAPAEFREPEPVEALSYKEPEEARRRCDQIATELSTRGLTMAAVDGTFSLNAGPWLSLITPTTVVSSSDSKAPVQLADRDGRSGSRIVPISWQ